MPSQLSCTICVMLRCRIMVQGDKEKAAGLPVSPLMDRSMKGGMTRSQVCTAPHTTPWPTLLCARLAVY